MHRTIKRTLELQFDSNTIVNVTFNFFKNQLII